MKEKGLVAVIAVVMCITNMLGVLGIPRPGVRQEKKTDNQNYGLIETNAVNVIDDVISGIMQLMEKERLPNKAISESIKSSHEESTQNKVISHDVLVPITSLTVDNVINVANLAKNDTLSADDTVDTLQIGCSEKQTEHAGKKDESENETGNTNIDDEATWLDESIVSTSTLLSETTETAVLISSTKATTSTTSPPLLSITALSNTSSTTTSTTLNSTTTTTTTTSTKTVSEPTAEENENVKEEDLREVCDAIPTNSILRNGLGSTGFTWPGGKIPYQIGDGFNETQRSTIQSAIDYYNTEFEGCLEWVAKGSQSNYVTFENTGTCSSRIGVAFYPFPVSQSIYLGRCSHLEGHIKHEMMHTIGFYHEHSRSDRDMYIKILWNNIPPSYHAQFSTYRWTTGYGEKYDYESIMHYSSRAFVKDYNNKDMRSIIPTDEKVVVDNLGFKPNLSEIDIKKIRKMYKCDPYKEYKASCSNDDNCGLNEYCALFVGECRTKLPVGSLCVLDRECLDHCGGGVCSKCIQDSHCQEAEYCTYKYLPGIEKECTGYCGGLCLLSSQCGGECSTCGWSFQCEK